MGGAKSDEEGVTNTKPLVLRSGESSDEGRRNGTNDKRTTATTTSNNHSSSNNNSRTRFTLNVRQLSVLFMIAMVFGALFPLVFRYLSEESMSSSTQQEQLDKDTLLYTSTPSDVVIDDDDNNSNVQPKIAWLMSFPNSGTSLTLQLVYQASGMNYASNYGDRHIDKETGLSMPLYPNIQKKKKKNKEPTGMPGPYWAHARRTNPTNLAITKTHCGGVCNLCRPRAYLLSPHNFETACRTSKGLERQKDGQTAVVSHVYSKSLVRKAIHVIRNPFDNLVSRFHLELHKMDKANAKTNETTPYTDDPEGFRSFCNHYSRSYHSALENTTNVDRTVLDMVHRMPCFMDLFRYIQWHNLAFVTTRDFVPVPTYILYFEEYAKDVTQTLRGVLDFLEFPQIDWNYTANYSKRKDYRPYYTDEERAEGKVIAKALASVETWKHIQHYFD